MSNRLAIWLLLVVAILLLLFGSEITFDWTNRAYRSGPFVKDLTVPPLLMYLVVILLPVFFSLPPIFSSLKFEKYLAYICVVLSLVNLSIFVWLVLDQKIQLHGFSL